jgi:hypothetical protein
VCSCQCLVSAGHPLDGRRLAHGFTHLEVLPGPAAERPAAERRQGEEAFRRRKASAPLARAETTGCGGTVDYPVDAVFSCPALAESDKVAALDAANKMRAVTRLSG